MSKKRNGVIKIISYLLVIIILVSLIIITNKPRESTVVETVLSYTILPIQRGFNYLRYWILGYRDVFPQIDQLEEKVAKLEKENDELKQKNIDYDLIKNENIILKEQMNLSNKYPEYKTLSAQIISYDSNSWQEVLIINQGSNDGVKEGMTVIGNEGLVGYIKTVFPETSQVILIIDSGSSVSGRISKSRESVICRGELGLKENSQMKLMYIPTDVELTIGDIVETSGLGGIYKKGIKIGQVEEIVKTENVLENYAIIKTSVNFSTLEYVVIIMD